MLAKQRDEPAASAFLNKAIGNNGLPKKVVIDKSVGNLATGIGESCLVFNGMLLSDGRYFTGKISE